MQATLRVSTLSRVNAFAVHSQQLQLQLTDEKKLAAVLSNFRSQYFRYFAAKCDLNTPALCLG